MPLNIICGDISELEVDAVVNSVDPCLKMGGSVTEAIFDKAGREKMLAALKKLAPIELGEAVVTPGFDLAAKFVIHAAGPNYRDGKSGEEQILRSAYLNSFKRAVENRCQSLALPLISCGASGYPKQLAVKTAASAIKNFIERIDLEVILVIRDKRDFSLNEKLLGEVISYINFNFQNRGKQMYGAKEMPMEIKDVGANNILIEGKFKEEKWQNNNFKTNKIEELVDNLNDSFAARLLELIELSGQTQAKIYKRANLDRRLFSKIRRNSSYCPSKGTVLAFAVALELNLKETQDLLERAGFSLSRSRKLDVIVEYFIANGKYDIFEINETLFYYDLPLLGG
ncbi:MAG: macro domain-containing protein [Deltaproteobacteria bacterium]|jgi:O-acetyl-ADP-ribose deacetylase (regulator of RNase III)|nr:macro domain-containing protein [Deltaproteobacteria bacterium]